jgi:hypothetical protein
MWNLMEDLRKLLKIHVRCHNTFQIMESTFLILKIFEFSFFDYHFFMKGNLVFVQGRGLFLISLMILTNL